MTDLIIQFLTDKKMTAITVVQCNGTIIVAELKYHYLFTPYFYSAIYIRYLSQFVYIVFSELTGPNGTE